MSSTTPNPPDDAQAPTTTPKPEMTPDEELEAARIVIRAAVVTFEGYAAEAAARRKAEADGEPSVRP